MHCRIHFWIKSKANINQTHHSSFEEEKSLNSIAKRYHKRFKHFLSFCLSVPSFCLSGAKAHYTSSKGKPAFLLKRIYSSRIGLTSILSNHPIITIRLEFHAKLNPKSKQDKHLVSLEIENHIC